MLVRNIVCSVIVLAIVYGMGVGLKALQGLLGFSGYMLFCAVGVALMVTAAYAFDYYSARSRSQR